MMQDSMKPSQRAFMMFALLLGWAVNGYADRLYTWTDAKGVTHITQDPPPDTVKVVDTIDYSPQPSPPLRRSTARGRTNPPQGNLNQRSGQARSGSGGGFAPGDEGNDVQYDGDSYRRTLLRYEIKHKWLDDNEPGPAGNFPVKTQPRPRK
jgi:hypothetical protein